MNYEPNQARLAEITEQYLQRLEKMQWFYENSLRGKSLKIHTSGKFNFFIHHTTGQVLFSSMDSEGGYNEFLSYHPDAEEDMIAWDGDYNGIISFNEHAQVSMYDHYGMSGSHTISEYRELNDVSTKLAKEMFPVQKEFTLTEEEHFQYSMIYDLLPYEDMRTWHKVLTKDYGEVKGMVFFSVYNDDLTDAVLQALVNMDGISKGDLE